MKTKSAKQKGDKSEEIKTKDYYIPKTSCPYCDQKLDGAWTASFGNVRAPNPGDFSICISCAQVLQFGEGMLLRKVSSKQLRELDPEFRAELELGQLAVRRLDRRGKDEK